jgi:hypothetical protein
MQPFTVLLLETKDHQTVQNETLNLNCNHQGLSGVLNFESGILIRLISAVEIPCSHYHLYVQ